MRSFIGQVIQDDQYPGKVNTHEPVPILTCQVRESLLQQHPSKDLGVLAERLRLYGFGT